MAGKVKGGNGGYFRYFLDDAGSEKCKEFDWYFNLYPNQSYPYLRQKGLPISKCIAGERVTAAKISQSPSQTITCKLDDNVAWPGFVFAVALSGQGVCG